MFSSSNKALQQKHVFSAHEEANQLSVKFYQKVILDKYLQSLFYSSCMKLVTNTSCKNLQVSFNFLVNKSHLDHLIPKTNSRT